MSIEPTQASVGGATPSERITWRIAGAFYWGLCWRVSLIVGVIALPRGFLVGYYSHSPEPFKYDVEMWWIATFLQIPAGLWIFKRVLERGISGYAIEVRRR